MTQAKPNCVHYWIVDGRNVGTCTKCGEVRDFAKLRNDKHLQDAIRVAAAIRRREANHKS